LHALEVEEDPHHPSARSSDGIGLALDDLRLTDPRPQGDGADGEADLALDSGEETGGMPDSAWMVDGGQDKGLDP
jgi:hypothetical protein